MAMLAERRRKSKFVLTPMSKPLWTSGGSGVQNGKKLMEKMGWSAGKGLGASEQGITEPLRSVFKQDSKGMGYKGDGNPFENLDQFNALLASLSENEKALDCEGQDQSFESLEEKSKKSRSRVHYKKFTRGKDLSKYTSDDLSCIVGNGRKEEKVEVAEEEFVEDHIGEEQHSHGVTTINSGSIADYFKAKLDKKRLKSREEQGVNVKVCSQEIMSCEAPDETTLEKPTEKKVMKSKKKHKEDSTIHLQHLESETREVIQEEIINTEESEVPSRRQKKSKRHGDYVNANVASISDEDKANDLVKVCIENSEDVRRKKKRRKAILDCFNDQEARDQDDCVLEPNVLSSNNTEEIPEAVADKRKKKKKRDKCLAGDEDAQPGGESSHEESPIDPDQETIAVLEKVEMVKLKKRKNKIESEIEAAKGAVSETAISEKVVNQKIKRRESDSKTAENTASVNDDTTNEYEQVAVKKKRKRDQRCTDDCDLALSNSTEGGCTTADKAANQEPEDVSENLDIVKIKRKRTKKKLNESESESVEYAWKENTAIQQDLDEPARCEYPQEASKNSEREKRKRRNNEGSDTAQVPGTGEVSEDRTLESKKKNTNGSGDDESEDKIVFNEKKRRRRKNEVHVDNDQNKSSHEEGELDSESQSNDAKGEIASNFVGSNLEALPGYGYSRKSEMR